MKYDVQSFMYVLNEITKFVTLIDLDFYLQLLLKV